MKLLLLLIGLAVAGYSNAQNNRGEFATNLNGLMYSDADMRQLRFIVDSLNLKFKTCPLNKTFYSLPQARVYYVLFKSKDNDLREIKKDLDAQTAFADVIQKYSSFIEILDTANLLIRTISHKKEGDEYYYLSGDPYSGYDGFYWDKKFSKKENAFVNRWIYDYSVKRKNDDKYALEGHFFPEKLKQLPIPAAIGSLIQYVDCMVDTNSVVFLTDKYSRGFRYNEPREKDTSIGISAITAYVIKQMGFAGKEQDRNSLDEKQFNFAINNLKDDQAFKDLLARTIDDHLAKKISNSQLEDLAQHLGLYDKALLLKRSYRVMGSCSQDISPRLHAKDIAILAAQSHGWDIFLRAHLDIMNDRFERVTDGSYAYGDRKTYLKELEELNLNIVDLMIGLTLRADNVAKNHYYNTVWRTGWALTESKEKDRFEETAIALMKNNQLDEFNRGLVFLLFHIYLSYLNEKEQQEKIDLLKSEINSFPSFLQTSINKLEIRKRSD